MSGRYGELSKKLRIRHAVDGQFIWCSSSCVQTFLCSKVATLKSWEMGISGPVLCSSDGHSCYCERGSLQPEHSMFLFRGYDKLFCTLQPYREEWVVMFMNGKE